MKICHQCHSTLQHAAFSVTPAPKCQLEAIAYMHFVLRLPPFLRILLLIPCLFPFRFLWRFIFLFLLVV